MNSVIKQEAKYYCYKILYDTYLLRMLIRGTTKAINLKTWRISFTAEVFWEDLITFCVNFI
jgi:hypothetical protein